MNSAYISKTKLLIEKIDNLLKDEMILNSFIRNNLTILEKNNDTLIIGFENEESLRQIQFDYENIVLIAAQKVFGNEDLKIKLILNKNFKPSEKEIFENQSVGLNKKYQFKNFYVFKSNKTAFYGIEKILKNEGFFNPFIITSESGLGKTHLINAAGNYWAEEKGKKVGLFSSDKITELYTSNLENLKTINNLENKLKDYDVLIIDDFQNFESRFKTINFLYRIFNFFIENGKQIIISLDRDVKKLKKMPSRFSTRLSEGVNISILKPSVNEMKETLIKKLVEKNFLIEHWDKNALNFIVQNSQRNFRSIEGKINQIIFFSKGFLKGSFSLSKIKTIFNNDHFEEKYLTPERVIESVSKYYKIQENELIGKKRYNNLIIARGITVYLLRNLLNLSYKKIGIYFSKRNHSTIINAYKKIEVLKINDPNIDEALKIIEYRIYNQQ